ncbi:MAG: PilZ domain-containing protein [Planctomycetes bacterium]|nr:PilZ domain-containing protein [Planctomycetota bacterium]
MPMTVLVADPDDRTAVAFGAALRGTDFSFLGVVPNGKALLDALFSQHPWAVALDLSLPDHPAAPNVGWAATVPQIREIAPNIRTLVTFRPELAGLVRGTIAAGARAAAEKPFIREEILGALQHLATDRPAQNFFARARRVPRSLSLRYRISSGANTSITRIGHARNVSETGLFLALSEKLPARSVVQFDVELPDRTTVRGRGQVVREVSVAAAGGAGCGVAIFEMEAPHRARLREFIARVLAGDPGVTAETRGPGALKPPGVLQPARG